MRTLTDEFEVSSPSHYGCRTNNIGYISSFSCKCVPDGELPGEGGLHVGEVRGQDGVPAAPLHHRQQVHGRRSGDVGGVVLEEDVQQLQIASGGPETMRAKYTRASVIPQVNQTYASRCLCCACR